MESVEIYKNTLRDLPIHLKNFCVDQNYPKYTAEHQASWRFILKTQVNYLQDKAHPAFVSGLKKTGISLEHIPTIEEMNQCLSLLGWKAVVVDGFVPPSIFMEFNSHKILPIAADLRTYEHLLYTPAPDIVHEAAGHAPIIADSEYSEYLKEIGEVGKKAIFYQKDLDIYEKIRHLSMLKENPQVDLKEIELAEQAYDQAYHLNKTSSEATKVSRLHWWTVEYGLYGELKKPLLYGAGLLSSMHEARSCLKEDVKKIWLDLGCLNYSYDVTRPQPQLFVTPTWKQLFDSLHELKKNFSYLKGGEFGLKIAVESKSFNTVELDSGLQISGVVDSFQSDGDAIHYLKISGPCSLSYKGVELEGQGVEHHSEGFSTLLGRPIGFSRGLHLYSPVELAQKEIIVGNKIQLDFPSGMKFRGQLKEIIYKNSYPVLFSFVRPWLIDQFGKTIYKSETGSFELALGEKVVSVFSGPADREKNAGFFYQSKLKTPKINYSSNELKLHKIYQEIRDAREKKSHSIDLNKIYNLLKTDFSKIWLARYEILELLKENDPLKKELLQDLLSLKNLSEDKAELINMGLERI